jgi:hypothetical protein
MRQKTAEERNPMKSSGKNQVGGCACRNAKTTGNGIVGNPGNNPKLKAEVNSEKTADSLDEQVAKVEKTPGK